VLLWNWFEGLFVVGLFVVMVRLRLLVYLFNWFAVLLCVCYLLVSLY